MPRYFFHIQDGQDLADSEGAVYANPRAARSAAVIASGEMLKDFSGRSWSRAEWRMHVVDQQGATVCDLCFTGKTGAR